MQEKALPDASVEYMLDAMEVIMINYVETILPHKQHGATQLLYSPHALLII